MIGLELCTSSGIAQAELESHQTHSNSVTVLADEYSFSIDQKAHFIGDVQLQYQTYLIQSDEAFLDHPQQFAEFSGSIRFNAESVTIEGDMAQAKLDTAEYNLFPARFWLTDNPGNGVAQKLSLLANNKIEMINSLYTTCDASNPEWSVVGRRISLDPNKGWGSAQHMRLQIQEIPVFYTPYFRFPLDDQRHSGVLYPEIYNLTEPDIAIPLYWNIKPNFDWTLTPRKIGGRGILLGNDWRYLDQGPQTAHKGEIEVSHLEKDKSYLNESRTQFKWLHDSQWQRGKISFESQLQYHYLSDNDYLDDFGNSLQTTGQVYIPREATLTGQTSHQQWQLRLEQLQTLDENIALQDRPYRRLPELNWTHFGLPIGPAHWQNQLNYVYFEQPDALETPYGHRLHWTSDLNLPYYSLWGFIDSTLRLQHTEYQLSEQSQTEARSLPTFILDAGLFFERDFTTSKHQWLQTLEPRLYHTYTPFEEQSDLPNFDANELTFSWAQLFRANRFSGFDRIGDTHQTTIALTQQWFSQDIGFNQQNNSDQTDLPTEQRLRYDLTLGQIVYHRDRRVTQNDLGSLDSRDTSTLSPMIITGRAYPFEHWQLEKNLTWDSHTNQIEEGYIGTRFQSLQTSNTRLAYLGYRYNAASTIKQTDFAFAFQFHPKWTLLGRWHFDLDAEKTLEQISGIRYESCCWNTHLTYHRRVRTQNDIDLNESNNQYRIMIEFELKGLARVGTQTQALLQSAIPGYQP